MGDRTDSRRRGRRPDPHGFLFNHEWTRINTNGKGTDFTDSHSMNPRQTCNPCFPSACLIRVHSCSFVVEACCPRWRMDLGKRQPVDSPLCVWLNRAPSPAANTDWLVGYPSGQRGQTVNLLAYAYAGSNPAPTTTPLPHRLRIGFPLLPTLTP